jgi:hypothetical protein
MRTRLAAAAGAGVLLAAMTGCATSDGKGELAVDAQLWLCRGESCIGVPAQGAQVEILVGESVVDSGVLDASGRYVTRVDPGIYSARATVPQLGIESPGSTPMSVTVGGATEIGFMLPQVQVSEPDPTTP